MHRGAQEDEDFTDYQGNGSVLWRLLFVTFKHLLLFQFIFFLFWYNLKFKTMTITKHVDIKSGSIFYGKTIGE